MNFWRYCWRTTRGEITVTALLVAGFAFAALEQRSSFTSWNTIRQNWIEPFFTMAPIVVALFIWFNEKLQDWENELPRRLDASFYYEGNIFYKIETHRWLEGTTFERGGSNWANR